eukprot:jgi/Mesvir1/25716/Mv01905-RA.1
MKRLEGKVAVVTASTAGIGQAIAERLGQEGARVVISSRKKANVDATVANLTSKGIRAIGVVCHVGKEDQRQQLLKSTLEAFGGVDVLVSNAASNPEGGPVLALSEPAIDKLLEVNVKAPILLIKEFAPHMRKGGSIVMISSVTAYSPAAPLGAYAVTKTALLGLTKALAAELAPDLRVNCVAPGIVATKFAQALVDQPEKVEAIRGQTVLGRLGQPQDMAAAVAYLVSCDASYVTGETLVVAGGMQSRL